jgi:hypothetical protein
MPLHGIHMEREEEVEQESHDYEVRSQMREMSLSWRRLERLDQDRDVL